MLHHRRMSGRKLTGMLLAAVMLVLLLSACGAKKETKEEYPGSSEGTTVASYDGGKVTDVEFKKYMGLMEISDQQAAMYFQIPEFKKRYLEQYVVYKAFAKRASEEDFKAAAKQADEFKKQLETSIKSQKELKDQLDKSGLTVDEAAAIVKQMVASSKIIEAKRTELTGQVTDADLKKEYDKAPGDYNIVTVRHILIKVDDPQTGESVRTDAEALKIAKEVKAKLEAGGDWNALAKQYSEDEGSKDKGGLYEKQKSGGWVQAFKDAANKQEIGKIGDPVKSEFGYHVMKVEAREATPFDKLAKEDKDSLKTTVVNANLDKYMQGEQDKLHIKITLPEEPKPSASPSASESPSPSK
jgi:foldase protein PrsA